MEYVRPWFYRPRADDGQIQTLPYRSADPRPYDPLLGIPEITRTISPLEEKRLQDMRKNVAEARDRFDRAEDPTHFATNFMKREDTGGPPSLAPPKNYGADFRLESVHGPYPDSQRNNEPGKHVYIWQNPVADRY